MPWAKGQSGNTSGRPRRGQSFADALRAALREKDRETKQTALQQVATAAVRKAIAGDLDAIKFVAERTDGKVPDQADVRHSGDLSASVTVVLAERPDGPA
jgi:hypothetical protein